MSEQVVIAGAGPAGISCAIQLKRAAIPFLLVNRGSLGGSMNNAFLIENLPLCEQAPGPEMVQQLLKQLDQHGIDPLNASVSDVETAPDGKYFNMRIGDKACRARKLVVATGTRPKRIKDFEIPGRTFYEVHKMRGFTRAQVGIVGSGEAAYDSALSLAQAGNQVVISTNKKPQGVVQSLLQRTAENNQIEIQLENPVQSIEQSGGRLLLQAKSSSMTVDYLLICVGRQADLTLLKESKLVEHPDLLLCGDARRGRLGQCAIAIGDGVASAMQIIKERTKWN